MPMNEGSVQIQTFDSCSTCGVRLTGRGSTAFPCPNCGNARIGRCEQCRDQSAKYTCKACGFSGP